MFLFCVSTIFELQVPSAWYLPPHQLLPLQKSITKIVRTSVTRASLLCVTTQYNYIRPGWQMALQKPWVLPEFCQISWVSQSWFLHTAVSQNASKVWKWHFFIKWSLNVFKPECLEITLKTIWSPCLANKKSKLSQAHQEKYEVSLCKVLHLP